MGGRDGGSGILLYVGCCLIFLFLWYKLESYWYGSRGPYDEEQ